MNMNKAKFQRENKCCESDSPAENEASMILEHLNLNDARAPFGEPLANMEVKGARTVTLCHYLYPVPCTLYPVHCALYLLFVYPGKGQLL